METVSLSGMGGGYEEMCQRMLWRGVAHLAEVKPPVEMWAGASSLENVYGILVTEGDDLKGLEEAIIKKDDDVTGAMHQCVMGHLNYIHKNGTEGWIAELRKHREEEDFFEWSGIL